MKKAIFLGPVFLTPMLVAWTALVYKYSGYGSWQIYPALAIMPLVLICHIVLIIWNSPRLPFVVCAVVHMVVLIPIWYWCLVLISKDSL
jgi:hypothetical protein